MPQQETPFVLSTSVYIWHLSQLLGAFAREDHPTISFLFGLEYEVVRMWIYSALGIVLTNCHFGHMITFWPHIWVILCSFTNSILYGSILLWLQVGTLHWIAGSLCTPSVLKWYVYFDQGKVIQSRFWPLFFFTICCHLLKNQYHLKNTLNTNLLMQVLYPKLV